MLGKQNYHNRLIYGLFGLLLIGITFAGCDAEKDIASDASQGKFIIKRCSMKDAALQTNQGLRKAVNQLKSLYAASDVKAVNDKIVFDVKSGLFYNDEKGLFISHDEKQSFTFPVVKDDPNAKIENICFNKRPDGNFDVFLVKYNYTADEYKALSADQIKQSGCEFTAITKDGGTNTARVYCIEVVALVSFSPAPIDEGELTGNFGNQGGGSAWVTIASSCTFSHDDGVGGGGGGETSGTHGNNGGGGGAPIEGNGPTPDPTPTPEDGSSPTPTEDNDPDSILTGAVVDGETLVDPCQELKAKTLEADFKNKFISLNNQQHFGLNYETGYLKLKMEMLKNILIFKAYLE